MTRIFRSALGASLIALAVATAGFLGGCGGGGHSVKQTQRAQVREYRIGAEDVLEIAVWKEPELSRSAPVRPDGYVTVPVAGEIKAAGKTAKQLEQEIAAKLAERITSPVVTVTIKEINSSRVFVLGEVTRPGVYPLRGTMSVLQLLAIAGGLTEFADGDEIVVLRRTSTGEEQKLRFDYDAAVGGSPFDLEPGDTIVVP